jgi:hypothetical protein
MVSKIEDNLNLKSYLNGNYLMLKDSETLGVYNEKFLDTIEHINNLDLPIETMKTTRLHKSDVSTFDIKTMAILNIITFKYKTMTG